MLDEEWLNSLRFELPDEHEKLNGCTVDGLLGIGSAWIIFSVVCPNGEKYVFKHYTILHHFLKETPLTKLSKSNDDIRRINQKLYRLIGNSLVDKMCRQYNRLYSFLICDLFIRSKLTEHPQLGFESLILNHFSELHPEILSIFHTPGIKQQLSNLSTLSHDESYIDLSPLFPNAWGRSEEVITWAKNALEIIENIPIEAPLKPDLIAYNPLYIWGAAVMDELLMEQEMPAAVTFIEEKFGKLTEHVECVNWISQISWIIELYVRCLENNSNNILKIKRFAKLCSLAGYIVPVYDKNGNIMF
jgi:hypothetical protein